MTKPRNNAPKTRGKPFPQGNPGRPKGSRHKYTMAAQALLDGEAEALTRRAIDAALGGDTAALRLCLERVVPVRKGAPIVFNMPAIDTVDDIGKALGAVVAAVAAGDLTPDEGAVIAGLLETKRKTIETVEIEKRLTALEERAKK